jgi:hypothetical protein
VTNSAGSVTSNNATLTVTTGISLFPATIQLSTLNGTNGFTIQRAVSFDGAGGSVSDAGDVNGDGIGDLIVGAAGADVNGMDSGAAYVVFGKQGGLGANVKLSSLVAADGFRITGEKLSNTLGSSVSAAGDINGDGIDDIIVGAPQADVSGYNSGAAYVVFGKVGGFGATLDASTVTGANGFRITGVAAEDYAGSSVSAAGDINGDGIGDLIVGAGNADPNGSNSGAAYVVFGKKGGFAKDLKLSTLAAADGFRITGAAANDQAGSSVSAAGDVNGDGIGDLIVGAVNADPNGSSSGAAYVVFGKKGGFGTNVNLSSLAAADGFRISGVGNHDRAGSSVSAAGDINGDGIGDLIVGAPQVNVNNSGAAYVVFGNKGGFGTNLNLSALNGANGFRIVGAEGSAQAGKSVSAAGDVNGDGIGDLIVGAWLTGNQYGAAYVVFGKTGGFAKDLNPSSLDGANGFRIAGTQVYDRVGQSVSAAGDVNGDGIGDLIVGAQGPGAAYVIYGRK